MAFSVWAPLELAINRLIDLDPDARERLLPLHGKLIRIQFRNLPLAVTFRVGDRALHVISDSTAVVDVEISGTPIALAKLGLQRRPVVGVFADDVVMSGDVDAGRRFKAFLDKLDIDWEEQLSRVVGDGIAHGVGEWVRATAQWGRQVVSTLQEDAAEYLQEESRDVPRPAEVQGFLDEVDRLRQDADRLEQRVLRLQRWQSEKSDKSGRG